MKYALAAALVAAAAVWARASYRHAVTVWDLPPIRQASDPPPPPGGWAAPWLPMRRTPDYDRQPYD